MQETPEKNCKTHQTKQKKILPVPKIFINQFLIIIPEPSRFSPVGISQIRN